MIQKWRDMMPFLIYIVLGRSGHSLKGQNGSIVPSNKRGKISLLEYHKGLDRDNGKLFTR